MLTKKSDLFWKGSFGDEYQKRSPGDVESNAAMFRKILGWTDRIIHISSVIEFGAGVGSNLKAIKHLLPDAKLHAVEINQTAAEELRAVADTVDVASVVGYRPTQKYDLVLTKGLLIHIPPEDLPLSYEAIYEACGRYVLICEYYSPNPVEIPYRGYRGVLWKRDFAGELMERYENLKLVDYGFVYRRDKYPQDDLSWFLTEKQ